MYGATQLRSVLWPSNIANFTYVEQKCLFYCNSLPYPFSLTEIGTSLLPQKVKRLGVLSENKLDTIQKYTKEQDK